MAYFKTYIIKDGDTVHSISQTQLGTAYRGLELAVLNNLKYPFIGRLSNERIEGVAYPGDKILIPLQVEDEYVMSDLTDKDGYKSQLGSDLSLIGTTNQNINITKGGELEINQGDLQTTSGVECLAQDLHHALQVEQGTLIYHPEYGSKLHSLIGGKRTSEQAQLIALEVNRVLTSDDRVSSISDLEIEHLSTGVQIKCNVHTPYLTIYFDEIIELRGDIYGS